MNVSSDVTASRGTPGVAAAGREGKTVNVSKVLQGLLSLSWRQCSITPAPHSVVRRKTKTREADFDFFRSSLTFSNTTTVPQIFFFHFFKYILSYQICDENVKKRYKTLQ